MGNVAEFYVACVEVLPASIACGKRTLRQELATNQVAAHHLSMQSASIFTTRAERVRITKILLDRKNQKKHTSISRPRKDNFHDDIVVNAGDAAQSLVPSTSSPAKFRHDKRLIQSAN
jgi:hypothetical protein